MTVSAVLFIQVTVFSMRIIICVCTQRVFVPCWGVWWIPRNRFMRLLNNNQTCVEVKQSVGTTNIDIQSVMGATDSVESAADTVSKSNYQ